MEKLMQMLEKNYPYIDFEAESKLMTDGLIDSLAVVAIIANIEETFDVSVTMEYIQPRYFESANAMWEMVEDLL